MHACMQLPQWLTRFDQLQLRSLMILDLSSSNARDEDFVFIAETLVKHAKDLPSLLVLDMHASGVSGRTVSRTAQRGHAAELAARRPLKNLIAMLCENQSALSSLSQDVTACCQLPAAISFANTPVASVDSVPILRSLSEAEFRCVIW